MRARHELWLCTLAVLALLAPRLAHAQLLSPGELSRAHQSLDSDTKCLECHSSGKRTDNQLCNHCHGDVAAAVRAGTGLHGKQYAKKPCAECHIEHRGRDFALVRWPASSRDKFDHALTGWLLAGKHAEQSCNKCHKRKNDRGAPTLFGLSVACSSCHEDPHKKRFGSECTQCHDEKSWKNVRMEHFDHTLTRFVLKAKHADVACAKCHGQPPNAKFRGLQFAACTDCHKDPHAGSFGNECTSCHAETGWKDLHMKRGTHPGLSILGGHAEVACNTCHDRGNDKAPTKGNRCVSCHEPVHKAPFGNDCASCHKHIKWLGLPEALGHEIHGKTAFPLRGQHDRVDCEQCHLPKLRPAQRFRKLAFGRCIDCHQDAHQGEFAGRDGGECKACHDEHGFAPTRFDLEAHASTAFPLLGKHVAVACGACHANTSADTKTDTKTDSKTGAKPSPRLDWRVPQQQCATCHQNPHGDQFSNEMRQDGCAHCHTPTAWNVPNIDHKSWPLTGAHAQAQCASCHNTRDADKKASYRGAPRECEGCHEDAHKGQFRLGDPVRKCSECHTTTAFKIARFDHQRLTGYALEGKHEHVDCAKCHAQEALRNGETSVRYRLGYRKCADCHQNPHAEAGQ
jgi:hypothetical protein